MPQEKVNQQGAIYIGLREGQESHPSMGNLEGTYEFKETGLRKELSEVKAEGEERLFLEVSEKIGELVSVENLSFSASDNVTIEDNRIYFAYDPTLLGMRFYVNYEGTTGSNEQGLEKGFTTTEHYSVLVISTNMDTVRCLDLIVKALLIMMRENAEEKNSHLLQRLQFGQIEEIDTGRQSADGTKPELLYGRETIVTYNVSYSLDFRIMDRLKEIVVTNKLDVKQGGEWNHGEGN